MLLAATLSIAMIIAVLAGLNFAVNRIYDRFAPCSDPKLEATRAFAEFMDGLPEVEEVTVTTHNCDSGETPEIQYAVSDEDKYWTRMTSTLECIDAPQHGYEVRTQETLHCTYGNNTLLVTMDYAGIAQ